MDTIGQGPKAQTVDKTAIYWTFVLSNEIGVTSFGHRQKLLFYL